MPAARKRAKTSHAEDKDRPPSMLLSDYRTCWLVKSDAPAIEIIAKDEVFSVHKSILTTHSEYFETCLNKGFAEAADNLIRFEDIDPKYLGYYLGLAASYSSIVPHIPLMPLEDPEASPKRASIQDFVEVYKLCDRFLSSEMAAFMVFCIKTAIGVGHRALHQAGRDGDKQKALMRDFADGFEALNRDHEVQAALAKKLIEYFCEGIDYMAWDMWMEEVMNRPNFVAHVSKSFARKLVDAMTSRTKLKRKELSGPY
ncbi:hypothetical protein TOPH_07849 [Tolypocladium ophioglossoides CBS 100239]|uniref:BTB domain-containing protein n=1 Tax=Tolypocladium ophioglossoides (strain CBS 100239) TaxID=1163406 RepID=A0A0L0N178_TOLOC|nr:hypothetical protein TOPH_07849 [Tolypocladium ophioglossoides CBS 100239]